MMKRKVYNHARTRLRGSHCVYCGEPSNTDEHWPSAAYGSGGWILPACVECNVLAGEAYPNNFWERCEHVKSQLMGKYEIVLRIPDWNMEELEELGRDMRKEVDRSIKLKYRILERLSWSTEHYIARIDYTDSFT